MLHSLRVGARISTTPEICFKLFSDCLMYGILKIQVFIFFFCLFQASLFPVLSVLYFIIEFIPLSILYYCCYENFTLKYLYHLTLQYVRWKRGKLMRGKKCGERKEANHTTHILACIIKYWTLSRNRCQLFPGCMCLGWHSQLVTKYGHSRYQVKIARYKKMKSRSKTSRPTKIAADKNSGFFFTVANDLAIWKTENIFWKWEKFQSW